MRRSSCWISRRACARAAATNRAISAGLLTPGRSSTPLDTSTPNGRTAAIAAATLRGVQAAGQDQLACGARAAARAAPVARRAAAARRALEQHARAAARRRPAAAARTTGSTRQLARQLQLARDPRRRSAAHRARNPARISSTVACVGMARHRDAQRPGRARARPAAPPAPGVTLPHRVARTRSRWHRRARRAPRPPPRASSCRRS